MKNQLVAAIFVILIVLLAVFFLQLRSPTGQATGETIKIGFIGTLTGDAAVYGLPERNVVELAAEEINAEGGIDGKRLEIIYEDGKCSGKDAATAMQKLVSIDKVQVVLGGFCSSESLAAEPIATQNKVFLFSPGSSSPALTGISTFFARDFPSDATQGRVLAEVANQRGWKKVAFIQEQLDYPLGIYRAFASNFETFGGTTVKEEFAVGTTDFRSILIKLRAENPDALFIDVQASPAADRILKQLQELNWKPNIMVSDVVSSDSEIVQRNAVLLEGAFAAEFGVDENNPKIRHIVEAYKKEYGDDVPYLTYSQTVYDGIYLIRDAINAVGYDGEKIADFIRGIKDWQGASGSVTIGEDGDRVSGHIPKIIKNGKTVLLSEKQTIKIGATLPLTGNVAFLGESSRDAILLAKEQLADRKYTYEIIFEDDQLRPDAAVKGVTKLITIDKVDAVVSLSSGIGNVVSPITEQNKVIHLAIASDPNIANGVYNFVHWTPPAEEARVWVAEAQKRGVKRVAVLQLIHQGMQAVADAVKKEIIGTDIQIVAEEKFNFGERDFRTIILKAKEKNPDIYLLLAFSPEIDILEKQMKELGIAAPRTSIEGFELSDQPQLYEGYWFVNAAEPTGSFLDAYKSKYGKTPQLGAANAYDIVLLIAEAFDSAGDGTIKPAPEKVVDELFKIKDFSGALGTLSMGSDSIVFSKAVVRTIKDGKPVTLG